MGSYLQFPTVVGKIKIARSKHSARQNTPIGENHINPCAPCGRVRTRNALLLCANIIAHPSPRVNPFSKNIFLPSEKKSAFVAKSPRKRRFFSICGDCHEKKAKKLSLLDIYKTVFSRYNNKARQNSCVCTADRQFVRSVNLMAPTRANGSSPCIFAFSPPRPPVTGGFYYILMIIFKKGWKSTKSYVIILYCIFVSEMK